MKPTREQLAVIRHKKGHARVLAVAGSGKTTTMALRIQHLIEKKGVHPKRIRVLMFNRLASQQFREKLQALGIDRTLTPFVSTFHSFAYQFVQKAMQDAFLPDSEFWTGSDERFRLLVVRIIQELEEKKQIPEHQVDAETAMESIGLWKGALIPPSRAGHHHNPFVHEVYKRFEKERIACRALTYDDFIPTVIRLLVEHASLRKQWCGRLDHLIVDEYQDINLGQQKLIELLAGSHAEVMVVGDDDQTIYEWRGARPDYILEEFEHVFNNKDHTTYTLSRSFRFGHDLATRAHNAIRNNTNRSKKDLVAHYKRKKSKVIVFESNEDNPEAVHHTMAKEVKRLIEKKDVSPSEIWVLGRMYAQLSIFESQCLATGIPYRVLGSEPFFRRTEVQKLLDYLRVVLEYREPITHAIQRAFIHIANTPNRLLQRKMLTEGMDAMRKKGGSLRDFLAVLMDSKEGKLDPKRRKNVADLQWVLGKAHELANGQRTRNKAIDEAGSLMKWIVLQVDYEEHFRNYYGDGEDAFERMESLRNFTDFAHGLHLKPHEFLDHMKTLDSRRGAKPDALITMTTVHKTKGLEFDYIFIPSCQEGYMPCLHHSEIATYDLQGHIKEATFSRAIETERRLFYVALTRARKAVYIGTKRPDLSGHSHEGGVIESSLPSRFIREMLGD